MTWHRYTTDPLPVRGGVRSLVREQYHRRGTVCPDKKAGSRCSGWHGRWDVQIPFEDLIARGPAGELVPFADRKAKRAAHWFWVLAADANEVTYQDEPQSDGRVVDEAARPHRRVFERMCGYLWESDFRSTGTARYTGEQVFATLADPPAQHVHQCPSQGLAVARRKGDCKNNGVTPIKGVAPDDDHD